MNKNRKTSHILNVFQFDANGHVILPATLTIGENPHSSDNTSKIPSTAWIRTYVTGLSYLTGNQSITVSGDATGSGTTAITLTLANTAVTPGIYGSTTLVPVVTVDSKGRITSVTTAAISGSLTFTGDVTGTGTTGTSTGLTLAASGVTAGTYTKVTVDSKGRVTVGANASTTDISEGTNLYYTDARVGTYLTANSYATQSYVGTQIANLVASAPATLDTLNELSVALGNDPNFATSVATSIGTKQAQLNGTGFVKVIGTTVSYDNNTYLTSFTETDPIYVASTWYSTTNNATNWNTAYGWGNHASGGYLTGITSSQVTTALGYTPYNSTNPSGYITGITSSNVTTALGYTPYNSTNPSGYITGITSGNVTTALGYTPYNSTNPSGYITTSSLTWSNISGKPTALSSFTNDLGNYGGWITGYTETDTLASVTGRGATTTSTIIINAGAVHPLAISSSQRYQMQVRNTSNSINSGYGWWWFMDTNFNMGFHADGASDRFTLTRDGNLSVSGTVTGSNLSGTNTGDQTNISGNAGTVTNGVYTTGDQTIGGVKTFSSKIIVGSFPNSTTNTGEAWFGRASDRNLGTYTIQLGGNSASNRQFEVVDYGWSVVLFSVNSNGNITASGTVTGSNLSGTNTGDQTNISGNAATATVLSTGRTNYKGVTDGVVVGELMWKNYGNSHTIFDASAGTAPNGTAKSRHTPDYPITAADGNNTWGLNANLMGWNGANTYGVKVDWSRYAESAGSTSSATYATSAGNSATTSQTTFGTLTVNGSIYCNANNDLSTSSGGISFWSTGPVTTSWTGFKNNASTGWGYHGGSTATGGYSTYHIMDTPSRGWIWRYATPGGTNFAGTNVASIQSDTGQMALGSTWDGTASNPTFAQLNVCNGRGASTNYRDIDLKGTWASGEGHSISATHGSTSTNMVGQITFQHDSPGSRIKFGRIYHSGDQSTYPMELISSGSSANLYVTGDITAYYSDERLKLKVSGIENALQKVCSLSAFRYVDNELAKQNGYNSEKIQMGLSAQEIQRVAPEIVTLAHFDMEIKDGKQVSKSGENYLTINYGKLTPLLIEAIKEQCSIIDKLSKRIEDLENK